MDFLKKNLVAIIFFILLIVGLVVTLYLVKNRQQITSKATVSNVSIISPRTGEQVSGIKVIKATANATEDEKSLKAILSLDGQTIQDLRVDRVDNDTVSTIAAWNTKKSPTGAHKLEITIYNTSTNPPTNLGSNSIDVEIKN